MAFVTEPPNANFVFIPFSTVLINCDSRVFFCNFFVFFLSFFFELFDVFIFGIKVVYEIGFVGSFTRDGLIFKFIECYPDR